MEKAYKSKNTKAAFGLITSLACAIALSGCGTVEDSAGSSDPGSTTPGLDVADSPLYVEVTSNIENNTTKVAQGDCYFTSATAPGAAATKTCTIRIPELTLHFSDLNFNIGTASETTCKQVVFRPYFYRRSISPTYEPYPGATPITCATGTDPLCYGGAAPAIIGTSFPAVTGLYFLPANGLTMTKTLPASNTYGMTKDDLSFITNSHSTNNLATGARGTDLEYPTDELNYVGGSMRDYTVTCFDPWGNSLYAMTLIITDADTTSGSVDDAVDSYWDWFD